MYLFFDTETTGLPNSWKAPVTDVDNWPRLVQLACLLFDETSQQLAAEDYIIKPHGFTKPAGSARVHGITTERAMQEDEPIGRILDEFQSYIDQSEYLVAHNISFDEKIVGAEFLRAKMDNGVK